mgnify:CR=1 FL=1
MANENGRIGWNKNVITGLEKNPLMEGVFGEFNKAFLIGVITEKIELSHVVKEEKFYRTKVKVKRFSGKRDIVPIIIPEEIVQRELSGNIVGKWVTILGQYRSYNRTDKDESIHLELFLFAKMMKISKSKEEINEYIKELLRDDRKICVNNLLYIDGYICKKPNFRYTPSGIKICDLIIAVNRICGKSDYIPFIAWEEVADWAEELKVGSHVKLYGRLQSREYYKTISKNPKCGEWKITYEVSIIRVQHVM